MTDKTVVIGVGAQKGGTSWLHYFLKQHPQCAMSPIKELHYFDTIELESAALMQAKVKRLYDRYFADEAGAKALAGHAIDISPEEARARVDAWAALMTHDTVDARAYLEYLLMGSGDAKVVGEVTPAYAMLNAQSFRAMRSVSPKTKFIYVMRDPVTRLWSNLRMRAQKHTDTPEAALDWALADFDTVRKGGIAGIKWRSDYKKTIQTMMDVLPAADVHFDFFEHLFDGGGARVCKFLGITETNDHSETHVNEGEKIGLPQETGRIMREWLAPQYAFVRDRFGALPAKWERSLEVFA